SAAAPGSPLPLHGRLQYPHMSRRVLPRPSDWPTPSIIPCKQRREERGLADGPLRCRPRKIALHTVGGVALIFNAAGITVRKELPVVGDERIKPQQVLINAARHFIDDAVDLGVCHVPPGASLGLMRSLGPECDIQINWAVGCADDFRGIDGFPDVR